MAKSKRGLGMGLDALLKMNVQEDSDIIKTDNNLETDADKEKPESIETKEVLAGFAELSISKIIPNPNQPRKSFDDQALEELAMSIKNFGLLQPISVIKNGEFYEIIAGERRYRASKKIGLEKIPVIIKNISQKEKLQMSLVENIQRENLNSIEEALAYASLIETYSVTQEELANSIGKSRTTITNAIRLLNLDAQIRKWIIDGKLTAGHARAILSVENKNDHIPFANYIYEHNLSVREAEILSKKWPLDKKKQNSKINKKDVEIKNTEDRLQQKFQTKVLINGNSKKGRIVIDYFSQDELERIIELMGIEL